MNNPPVLEVMEGLNQIHATHGAPRSAKIVYNIADPDRSDIPGKNHVNATVKPVKPTSSFHEQRLLSWNESPSTHCVHRSKKLAQGLLKSPAKEEEGTDTRQPAQTTDTTVLSSQSLLSIRTYDEDHANHNRWGQPAIERSSLAKKTLEDIRTLKGPFRTRLFEDTTLAGRETGIAKRSVTRGQSQTQADIQSFGGQANRSAITQAKLTSNYTDTHPKLKGRKSKDKSPPVQWYEESSNLHDLGAKQGREKDRKTRPVGHLRETARSHPLLVSNTREVAAQEYDHIKERDTTIRYPVNMATVKKYAGLPDLDLGTEVYESAIPDLTEASTLPTGSDTSTDDENSDIDKQVLDPETARQLFEPTMVDARNVNFSDTINGGRRSYQIRTRRRRRRAQNPADDYSSDDSQEETLQGRLARLRREAIELQAEIERSESLPANRDENHLRVDRDEDGDSVYEDSRQQAHPDDLSRGMEAVNRTLNDIHLAARKKKTQTLEEEFLSKMSRNKPQPDQDPRSALTTTDPLPQSSITAIAAFSDRLTILESLLGVSSLSHNSPTTTSILPTLDVLTTQIETLHNTLTPTTNPTNPFTHSTTHLDPLAERIRQLISESKRLEQSRKAATKSFEEFLENRDRHAHLFHTHTTVHPSTLQPGTATPTTTANGTPTARLPLSRTPSTLPPPTNQNLTPTDQTTPLFLDTHATKITALHNILPTITSLEPLLPTVLERLRTLSVMHAGAADVKGTLDEMEGRMTRQESDIAVWRGVVERMEGEVDRGREVLKGNVEVLGGLVGGLEGRVRTLKGK